MDCNVQGCYDLLSLVVTIAFMLGMPSTELTKPKSIIFSFKAVAFVVLFWFVALRPRQQLWSYQDVTSFLRDFYQHAAYSLRHNRLSKQQKRMCRDVLKLLTTLSGQAQTFF